MGYQKDVFVCWNLDRVDGFYYTGGVWGDEFEGRCWRFSGRYYDDWDQG